VSTRTPSAAAALIGQVIDGKYRLDSMIGRGGMGAVFRGFQLSMDRRIAVKIIHPELAADPAVSRRFAREARGTFKVESEHAIKVLDFAESRSPMAGLLYMVMEFLDGRTVAKELDVDGPLAPRRALHVAGQVAQALATAHRIGIIHRDIKPDNIMLIRHNDDPDFAKVLDFGLAKLIEGAPDDAGLSAAALTKHGMVFGTPDYMSPEQATGKPLDARSDIYALGATLFEMLTARPPFLGANAMAILVQHVKHAPPRLAELSTSLAPHRELEALIQRCLAKAPSARPASALELIDLLATVESRLPVSEPRMQATADQTMQLPASLPPGARGAGSSGHSAWLARLTEEGNAPADPPPGPLIEPGAAWSLPGVALQSAATSIADQLEPSAPTGLSRPVRIRRWPMVAGLIAIAGGVAVAVALARGGGTSRRTSGSADALAHAVEPVDARAADLPATDAAIAVVVRADAAIVVAVADAAPRPDADPAAAADRAAAAAERRKREIAQHLAAAELGYKAKNYLKQQSEADEVLQLDPRNARANFLVGDALIRSRDKVNGCKYLARSRSSAAKALMAEAGCK
jgi:eukaryotic-like serine/threonine-protein kinase